MKRIIIFAGIKILELTGILVGIGGICWVGHQVILFFDDKPMESTTVAGYLFATFFVGIFFLFLLSFLGWGLFELFRANWKWTARFKK